MLPPLDDSGNLPPGIHPASLDEIAARFGSGSAERRVEVREVMEFIVWARRAGVSRIIINGSFVTAASDPGDVDIVILPGPGYPHGEPPATEDADRRWPFLHIQVAADEEDLQEWCRRDFAFDRLQREKGVVEVIL